MTRVTTTPTTSTVLVVLHALPNEDRTPAADFPPEENIEDDDDGKSSTTTDWDAEWKKVVQSNKNPTKPRPGKDFYKSEAEIAAIKAANRATRELQKLQPPSLPSMRSLQGDWKVNVCCLIYVITIIFATRG